VIHCGTARKGSLRTFKGRMSSPRRPKPRSVKTEFLQIRLSANDRTRIQRAAAANYLDPSTWARQILLKAVYDHEHPETVPRRRVAEPEP